MTARISGSARLGAKYPAGTPGLASSRYYFWLSSIAIESSGSPVIITDWVVDFDDIGLGSDYDDDGNFYPPDGDYLVHCYTQMMAEGPDVFPDTGGYMFVNLVTAETPGNDQDGYPIVAGSIPKVSTGGLHRFTGGGVNPLYADVHLVGATADGVITEGVITFTRTKDLTPVESGS
jgi:hypothetical protein